MSRIVEFFKNDHIQMALATGASIIILAFVFKRVLHVELSNFEDYLPGIAFVAWEVAHGKHPDSWWGRPTPWIILCFLITAAVIARRVWLT